MIDPPRGDAVLQAVARWLREAALPRLPADLVFQARVAANAIDLVAREMQLGPPSGEQSRARIAALLGHDGGLAALEAELAEQIRAGALGIEAPGLFEHLLADAMARMAIDQPAYASHQAELTQTGAPAPGP
ncbi:MAG: DUF6285 domain-containing protein [Burkholderiales bacterium]